MGHYGAEDDHGVAGGEPVLYRVLAPDTAAQDLAQGQRVVFGECALGAVGCDHGCTESFGQADDFVGAAEHLDFLADDDGGTPRLEQELQSLFHHRRVALGDAGVAGADNFHVGTVAQKVGGKLELDGTGTAVLESLEGLEQVVGDGLDLADHGVPVGNGLKHAELVFGLMGGVAALADEIGLDVGGHL